MSSEETNNPLVSSDQPSKSAFVLDCEKLAEWAQDESIKMVDSAGIDPFLKQFLTKAIKEHFENNVTIDEDCNIGSLKNSEINQELLNIYHNFRNKAVYEGASYRNVGPEQKLLANISEVFRMAATKIEANRISRNLEQNT